MSGQGVVDYEPLGGERHRHEGIEHSHPHVGPHTHDRPARHGHEDHGHDDHGHDDHGHDDHGHDHHGHDHHGHDHHGHDHQGHGHSHGLVHDSIKRSREGVRAVSVSLAVLGVTAVVQALIFVVSGSVALLADLIHNVGDALTAVPLGAAFLLRSERAERLAGLAVVAAIFISACVAGVEAVRRLIHPSAPEHLVALAFAGAAGYCGNWVAARVRTRAGRRLDSPALIADGAHARADAYVSLAVIASAIVVALGFPSGDPLIGLAITLVILRITWQSWRTVRGGD
jgi:Co/Zn/Cd efflux system component